MARSISPASRTSIGRTSTPNDGATDWIAPNCPIPWAMAASRNTAACVTPGAISLSSPSHFALMPYLNSIKPVALPPGRGRVATKPAPTGSGVCVKTTGTVRVACSNGPTTVPPEARMTSGASATNSAAYLRVSTSLPPDQRASIRTLQPSVQPNCCSPCTNAARRAWPSASSAPKLMSTPMRRIRSGCCAPTASGHVAAPPRSVMNSRRLIEHLALSPPRRVGRPAGGLVQA